MEQYAEFLRSRRLGGIAQAAAHTERGRPGARLTDADAKAGFAERLRQIGHQGGIVGEGTDAGPVGADELANELAESWASRKHPSLYPTCSPHKVANTVLHLRDFYLDEYAAEIVAVLPEWIRFLAQHTGMAAELTERCLAYASGDRQFPGILGEDGRPSTMARVRE